MLTLSVDALPGTAGGWSAIAHPSVSVALARAGFDWLLFDLEHGTFTLPELRACLDAAAVAAELPVLARLPRPGSELTQQVTDLGVAGLLVPQVRSLDEVRVSCALASFPPDGRRGLGVGRYNYYGTAAPDSVPVFPARPLVMIQIETVEALRLAGEIAAVPGVDALFIGPSDLGQALRAEPDALVSGRRVDGVDDAVDLVVEAARNIGKPVGMWVPDPEVAARYRARGVAFFGVGTDIRLLASAAAGLAAAVRAVAEPAAPGPGR